MEQAGETQDGPAARARFTGRRRRARWPLLVGIVLLHLLAIIGLVRVFAPDFTASVVEQAASLVTVTVTVPEEPAPPPAPPEPDPGTAGEVGREAVAREVVARPNPKPVQPAPRAASTGRANQSGAREEGAGTGAGGAGEGTGSGAGGQGGGSGIATKPVHVSGQISDARDYPVPSGGRDARLGKSVIIALTVEPDGVPSSCRIYRSSGLPETDQVTCRLALERLRFRAATNGRGEPVRATFYWQQRFFF